MASGAANPTTLILACLAVYRVAHLIAIEDGPWDLAERLRSWVTRTWPPVKQGNLYYTSWQERGVNCPLCVSFWLALPAGAGVVVGGTVATVLFLWLGLAGGALLIHRGINRRPSTPFRPFAALIAWWRRRKEARHAG